VRSRTATVLDARAADVSGPNTTFRAELSADRGAIAMVSRSGAFTLVSVFYGTPAELETAGDTNPRHCFPAIAQTLLGTAIGSIP